MDKFYKNSQDELFVNPILSKHEGLVEITEQEFNDQLAINNSQPEPTAEEKVAMFRKAIGDYINSKAVEQGFDSILTAVTYADEPADTLNQSKGLALREWRSLCWEYCRGELETWQNTGLEPTVEELISGLPTLTVP